MEKTAKKYKNSIDISTLLSMEFHTYGLSQPWVDAIGEVEKSFRMIIYGLSGSGKTTFAMYLCKELANHGKVYYNSIEQGKAKSLQSVANHCQMNEVPSGRMVIGDRDNYVQMLEKLKNNGSRFVVIDSLDYINLTTEKYKELVKLFPRKSFIIVAWASGDSPKSQYAKAIEYMADIKTLVIKGVAHSRSRFGHTKPYYIFDKPRNLFNN